MKKLSFVSLLVAVAVMGSFCGCASNSGQTAETKPAKPAKAEKPPKDKRSKEERLKVGMTKDEVIQAIGKPRDKSVSSDGSEVWTYNDIEKAMFIPYYSLSGGKTHFLTVIFDTNGVVKSWSSSTHGGY